MSAHRRVGGGIASPGMRARQLRVCLCVCDTDGCANGKTDRCLGGSNGMQRWSASHICGEIRAKTSSIRGRQTDQPDPSASPGNGGGTSYLAVQVAEQEGKRGCGVPIPSGSAEGSRFCGWRRAGASRRSGTTSGAREDRGSEHGGFGELTLTALRGFFFYPGSPLFVP